MKKIRSTTKRFILIVLSVLLALAFINFLLYYRHMNMVYTDKLKQMNLSAVRRIADEYDASVDLVKLHARNMAYNNNNFIQLVETFQNNYDYKKELLATMINMQISNDIYISAYLYLLVNDVVLSTNIGFSSLNDFIDTEPIINFKTMSSSLSTIYFPNNNMLPRQPILSVGVNIPLYEKTPYGILIINVDNTKLVNKVINTSLPYSNITISIFDTDKNRIYGDDQYPEDTFDIGTIQSGILKTRYFDPRSNLIFLFSESIRSSVEIGATDYTYFILILLLLIFAFGIIAFSFFSLFKPFRRIITHIGGNSRNNPSDFTILNEYITTINNENMNLKLRLEETMPLYKNRFFKELITTPLYKEAELLEKLNYMNVFISLKNYIVLTFIPNTTFLDEEKKGIYKISALDCVRTNLSKQYTGFYSETSDSAVSIALNIPDEFFNEEEMSYVNDFAKNIRVAIEHLTGMPISIGIGSYTEDIQHLYGSYSESLQALNYTGFWDMSILTIYQVCKDDELVFRYPYEKEQKLLKSVSLGLYKESMKAKVYFFTEIRECGALDNQELSFIFYQLLHGFNKVIYENKLDIPYFLTIEHQAQKISEIEKIVDNLIFEITSALQIAYSKSYDIVEQEVINFLNDNFNKPIQLIDLKEKFNLNRFYIGQVIKERTGMNFNDYLNRKRIEYAKELLVKTKYSIKEITAMLSYSYSYYFSKMFKKYENLTPVEYRKKYRK